MIQESLGETHKMQQKHEIYGLNVSRRRFCTNSIRASKALQYLMLKKFVLFAEQGKNVRTIIKVLELLRKRQRPCQGSDVSELLIPRTNPSCFDAMLVPGEFFGAMSRGQTYKTRASRHQELLTRATSVIDAANEVLPWLEATTVKNIIELEGGTWEDFLAQCSDADVGTFNSITSQLSRMSRTRQVSNTGAGVGISDCDRAHNNVRSCLDL